MENPFIRPQPGKWAAAVFSVLMHGLLLLILYYGVHWQNKKPEAVSVELVRSLPPMPVQPPQPEKEITPPPKPVEEKPEPTPIKPDIALKEQEKKPPPKKKEEPKPVEQSKPVPKPEKKPEPKPEKKPEPKPEKKPEPDKKPETKKPDTQPRQSDYDRLMAREDAKLEADKQQRRLAQTAADLKGRTGTPSPGSANASGVAKWMDVVRAKVSGNILLPPGLSGRPTAEFEVELLVTGELKSEPRLTKSSGNPALDDAIMRAIKKSAPFAKPPEEALGKPNTFKFDPLDPKFSN